jgi:hypothetical protein
MEIEIDSANNSSQSESYIMDAGQWASVPWFQVSI